MERIALVAPDASLRAMLLRLGALGLVELDAPRQHRGADGAIDLPSDLTPAAAELERRIAQAVQHGPVAGLVGWAPTTALSRLAAELAPVGAAAVPLARPRRVDPPTLLREEDAKDTGFDVLVEAYATVPYVDVNPSLLAGLAYVVMFGMMFGDVGGGLLLLLAAMAIRAGRPSVLDRVRRAWPFVCGAGVSSVAFGFLYGEFFGPTGLVPVLWLAPVEHPVELLVTALGVGAVLLACAYAVGTVNRLREGGPGYALYARSGIAGSLVFVAIGLTVGGFVWHVTALVAAGAGAAVLGIGLCFVGLLAEAGARPSGVLQALIETFNLVVRLGTNLVSFARLAAFGLTHAALTAAVWSGTVALWRPGPAAVGAVLLFVVGNAVAFGLSVLVAGIQALRLEYYELFSRVFVAEGRPFRPWRLPADPSDLHRDESNLSGVA